MSKADRAELLRDRDAARPSVALETFTPRVDPPDGWRARMDANPPKLPEGYKEHDLQTDLVAWTHGEIAAGRLRELAFLFAVPNAGRRTGRERGRMLAEGLKAGVPDLFLPVPRSGFCGAVLELKIKGNRPGLDQVRWLDALQAMGHRVAVCYTLETAKNFLQSYLAGV